MSRNKKVRRKVYEPHKTHLPKNFVFKHFDVFTMPFLKVKDRIKSNGIITDENIKLCKFVDKAILEYKYLGKYNFQNIVHYLAICSSVAVARTGLYFRRITEDYLNDTIFSIFETLKISDFMIGDIEEELGMSVPIYNNLFVNTNIIEPAPFVDTLSFYTLMFALQKKNAVSVFDYISTFIVIIDSLIQLNKKKELALKEDDKYEIRLLTTEILWTETGVSVLSDFIKYLFDKASDELDNTQSFGTHVFEYLEKINITNSMDDIEDYFKNNIYTLNHFLANKGEFTVSEIPLNVKINRIDPSNHVIKLLNESSAKDIVVFPSDKKEKYDDGTNSHENEMLNEMLISVIDTQNCRILSNEYSNQLRMFDVMRDIYRQKQKENNELSKKISCMEKTINQERTKAQNYKTHSRELRDQIKNYESRLEELDTHKIDNLEKTVEDQRTSIIQLKKELSDTQSKLNNKKHKENKKDDKITSLEQENARLKEQLEMLMKEKDELQEIVDYVSEQNNDIEVQDDDFSDESLQIAAICRLTFFVPVWVNSKPLEKLFPNSKFIKLQEDSNFDIGSSSQGVILCTKGAAHATYYMITNQCEKYGIKLTHVPSYGVKTMFNAAINAL